MFLFQLLGSFFEIVGVVMMANLYTRISLKSFPKVLWSALIRGRAAEGVATVSLIKKNKQEEKISNLLSLQGLSLVALGFVCQAIGNVLSLFNAN